jgi:hypothetical protein
MTTYNIKILRVATFDIICSSKFPSNYVHHIVHSPKDHLMAIKTFSHNY